jgi:hypothetical protein
MRPHIHTITALTAATLLTLTACGSSSDTASATSPTTGSTAPATSAPAAQALDAKTVVQALADAVGDAKPATVYTAATDPNKLLGRPGGYTSKADFTDDRAKPDLDDEVQNGGSVEVYDDPADAEERGKFIADTLDKMKIFGTEYHYLKGGILLRVSGELTPEQAAEYETALNKL